MQKSRMIDDRSRDREREIEGEGERERLTELNQDLRTSYLSLTLEDFEHNS